MAILERLGYILPICSEDGNKVEVNPGTIAAGYQVTITDLPNLGVLHYLERDKKEYHILHQITYGGK